MKSRRSAREACLQALYSCDMTGLWTSEQVGLFEANYVTLNHEDSKEMDNFAFFKTLVHGIMANKDYIDEQINFAAENWKIDRMAVVDRNILRISAFELICLSEVPRNVSLNEAVEIAKRFGGDDTRHFVNGVLDKVARIVDQIPEIKREVKGPILSQGPSTISLRKVANSDS